MLKIIHAADFHLDSPFSGLTPEQAAVRRGEQRLLLDDLVALTRREEADLVLLSGDLLDGAHVYRETAQALARALGEMPCPVFIAPGNHDPYTPDSVYATVKFPENVHIFTCYYIFLLNMIAHKRKKSLHFGKKKAFIFSNCSP